MPKTTEFRVVDALRAPHGGWILRLRLESGEAPPARKLKGRELIARAPAGEERRMRVKGFPLFGGRRPDERLARTGRVDLHVEEEDDAGASSPGITGAWTISTTD